MSIDKEKIEPLFAGTMCFNNNFTKIYAGADTVVLVDNELLKLRKYMYIYDSRPLTHQSESNEETMCAAKVQKYL